MRIRRTGEKPLERDDAENDFNIALILFRRCMLDIYLDFDQRCAGACFLGIGIELGW